MKGVLKCAKGDDETRLGVPKAQAWGCPRHPQQIFKDTQASKLGDAPVHPLLHQQLSVRPSLHYIFITSCVMCYACSVSLFTFLRFVFALFVVVTSYTPAIFCVGEKHAPLELELLIGFA